MQKETEIKLRVSETTLAALRQNPILTARLQQDWTTHALFNTYYDTAQHDLARARVALRIRRDGAQNIQTLKSKGQSVAGLSERHEWDWYLEQPVLDTACLTDECWPAALAHLDRQQLVPIFTTDFVRTKADVQWLAGEEQVRVEVALDLGQVIAGELSEPLCELELELRQGSPVALLDFALELAEHVPLMPCDVSKAERGYRLNDPRTCQMLSAPPVEPHLSLDETVAQLAGYLLASSQRLAEHYRFTQRWTVLVDWVQQLTDLRALLATLGQAAPRASTQVLRADLEALLADWQPYVHQGQQDEAKRQAAATAFAQELEHTRWGLFSLRMARWLLQRSWTLQRTERGRRQGLAELGRWLPHYLAEEGAALQLPHYEHRAQTVVEQKLRMERLLVWLRWGRSILELPEVDRLYGELSKLYEMCFVLGAEEAALSAQIHPLWILKPWKILVR